MRLWLTRVQDDILHLSSLFFLGGGDWTNHKLSLDNEGHRGKDRSFILTCKEDLARIRVIAQARIQFKQLPHALVVNTSTRNLGLTTGEVMD